MPGQVSMKGIRLTAIYRSLFWFGTAAWLVYLRKPDGASVLSVRPGAIGWLGGVLVLIGTAAHLWANVSLARGERRGEAAPMVLILEGPYRYVRNPIYLSGVPLLFGTHLLYSRFHLVDVFAAIAVMALFHLMVVASEEPALRARYGSAYAEYCGKVPRWIPRLARNVDAPAQR